MGVIQSIGLAIQSGYTSFLSSMPSWAQQSVDLLLLVILVFFYCIFFWKFHKFISNKNLLNLNLRQYNTSKHPFFSRFFAGVFYVLEYIIILPIIVFLWFSVFTIFLILIANGSGTGNIMLVSVTIIGAVRMISYVPKYGKDLAQQISILFPLTVLIVFISSPGLFFDFSRILGHISEIPALFDQVLFYLLFMIFLETILRITYGFLKAVGADNDDD